MERPGKLAEILLAEDKGWDTNKVQDLLAKGYDSAVALDHPVPVHTTYFTAMADADGKITSFADLYGLDKKVIPALLGKTAPAEAEPVAETQTDPPPRVLGNTATSQAADSREGLFDTRR
jgi:murein L,D-transpeptidase YcbB/YkuD